MQGVDHFAHIFFVDGEPLVARQFPQLPIWSVGRVSQAFLEFLPVAVVEGVAYEAADESLLAGGLEPELALRLRAVPPEQLFPEVLFLEGHDGLDESEALVEVLALVFLGLESLGLGVGARVGAQVAEDDPAIVEAVDKDELVVGDGARGRPLSTAPFYPAEHSITYRT
jgi:hypothetical protein